MNNFANVIIFGKDVVLESQLVIVGLIVGAILLLLARKVLNNTEGRSKILFLVSIILFYFILQIWVL
jgi:multisubunit Na+/H+ antiporter MnhE subunit